VADSCNKTRVCGDDRGQALVEFALALPALLMVVMAIAQFGIAYNNYLRLTDAVRIGGRVAATQSPDTGDSTEPTACNAGKTAFKTNLSTPPATYACTGTTLNGDTAVTITGTYPFSIGIFGMRVYSGSLSSSVTERLL
jgi:Flp pilus assembly protein TadG